MTEAIRVVLEIQLIGAGSFLIICAGILMLYQLYDLIKYRMKK